MAKRIRWFKERTKSGMVIYGAYKPEALKRIGIRKRGWFGDREGHRRAARKRRG